MVQMVTEIAQGNTFSETSENGRGAFSATRAWKVLLAAPGEPLNINEVTGVSIGTPYSQSNPIPCVSIEGRPDGESRLVKIITATYRATPGVDPGVDPKTITPTARPALYSMSTSLQEIAAWGGKYVTGSSSGSWSPAVNPVGDIVDGISRLEPVVNIQIEQYSATDQSALLGYVGYVNSQSFTFSSLSIGMHCCMLQGLTTQPVVEQFGEAIFRGFKISFTFAVRAHYTITRNGSEAIGWDMAVPQVGFNIINSGLGNSSVDQQSLCLAHDLGVVKTPLALVSGTSGQKARAMVTVPATEQGKMLQRVAAAPVALNDDGTPRSATANPKVLINRLCTQPEMAFGNNFYAFGINSIN